METGGNIAHGDHSLSPQSQQREELSQIDQSLGLIPLLRGQRLAGILTVHERLQAVGHGLR